jgi:hypothetical protein
VDGDHGVQNWREGVEVGARAYTVRCVHAFRIIGAARRVSLASMIPEMFRSPSSVSSGSEGQWDHRHPPAVCPVVTPLLGISLSLTDEVHKECCVGQPRTSRIHCFEGGSSHLHEYTVQYYASWIKC